MQTQEHVTVDPQVLIGWIAPPAHEQAYILETLEALAPQSPDQWVTSVVQRLPTDEPLYLLRAHNGLLVTFRLTPRERITVLDLVLQETIERYFMPKSRSKPSESQEES